MTRAVATLQPICSASGTGSGAERHLWGHVIDYNGKDFLADLDRFDVIFDAVGKSSFVNCGPLLAPGGTYVTTLPKPSLFFWGWVQSIAGIFRKAKRAKGILVRPSGKDFAFLCQLADEGKLRPTVSLTLCLDRAAEAHEACKAESYARQDCPGSLMSRCSRHGAQ